jgi:iron(III) transport system ATP-binding protein
MLGIDGLKKIYKSGKRKSAGDVVAVDDVSLDVQEGEFLSLLGPSGCGKTTTLRCVAGLEVPDAGVIRVGGRDLFRPPSVNVPANRRGLGMVFQSYAIWPHMNVVENVVYPLTVGSRRGRVSRKEAAQRAERVLDVVQLGHLHKRRATDLSGGQQQRLALARALVMEPPLLLLDEPLSNLDARLREDMRLELKRMQRESGITTIYVTHDQVEALSMSTRVAVMEAGRIVQCESPRAVYERPVSRFVADFVGMSNFLEVRVDALNTEGVVVGSPFGAIQLDHAVDAGVGDTIQMMVRPEDVRVEAAEGAATGDVARAQGSVVNRAFVGDAVEHVIEVDGVTLRAKGPRSEVFSDGEGVVVSLAPDSCRALATVS